MREIIRNALFNNERFSELVAASNMYTYRVPETAEMQSDLIVYIDMLDVPTPYLYFDGEYHLEEYLTQIDCYAPVGKYQQWQEVNEIIKKVFEDVFDWKLRGGVDEFDDDVEVFRYGQRYQGTYKLRRDI